MLQNPPFIQQFFFVKYRQIHWQKSGKNVELVNSYSQHFVEKLFGRNNGKIGRC
jgi:hypothetical protein